MEPIEEAVVTAMSCSHNAATDIFLESVVSKELPRQMFPWISEPKPDWMIDDIGMIQAFDCNKNPLNRRVYGYRSDVDSCAEHGNFVMFTRATTPIVGKTLYINMYDNLCVKFPCICRLSKTLYNIFFRTANEN